MEENKELKLDELENVNGGSVVASGFQNKILDLGAGEPSKISQGRVAGVQIAGIQAAGLQVAGMSGAIMVGAAPEVCPEEMEGPCEA